MTNVPFTTLCTRSDALPVLQLIEDFNVIAVQCDGVRLRRNEELSVILVCTYSTDWANNWYPHVYVFDVAALGSSWLFDSGLRRVLEDADVAKYMFDCRATADILLHRYNVYLRGIRDVQILIAMAQGGNNKTLMGRSSARSYYLRQAINDANIRRIYAEIPHVWTLRPFDTELLHYSVDAVGCLHQLYRRVPNRCNMTNFVGDLVVA